MNTNPESTSPETASADEEIGRLQTELAVIIRHDPSAVVTRSFVQPQWSSTI
jgi:hypothetical protein